ncbi:MULTISPECIES: phosphoribosylanthranilate isomerase [Clostridium]|uniref:N-(5'-phosphoribosyl)anthranilate isomerase n=1 Tax=Clostridium cibarium TaxID=2762247 RepID=A0ABR8PYM7_9CLOT|nr:MULTISPECIES: phosphoribosylanthranilate isomerase [Clostridium]MBD7913237.1 phosphoribosylanthranilate isomerase [Clostridium cibarium]
MKIKICGITSEKEIEFLNDLQPDYIGFVFAKSKRIVSKEKSKLLYDKLDKKIKAVGVFRNNEIEYVKDILKLVPLNVVQLHGDEDEDFLSKLREDFKGEIWKGVCINDENDIKDINKIEVDSLVLDGSNPGEGKIFPWKYMDNKLLEKKLFLAGGINEDNVLAAIEEINPYGIDLSSGVESIIDGKRIKDEIKVKRLIDKVRERYER